MSTIPYSMGEVLALAERGAAGTNAAWRAALVARDRRARLRLLHARADTEAIVALANEIRGHLGLEVVPEEADGDALPGVLVAARRAGLLVMGARQSNPLRDSILGTQAERLLRLCRVPVLVVKRPANAGYRRVLVPVDLTPDAGRVIAAARAFSRDPAMEVFHALATRDEVTMRVADVPEYVVRSLRNGAAGKTRALLQEMIAFGGAAGGALPAVAFGDAAGVILARERAMRAELVVLAKRRRGLLADFFLGSVTRRVLAGARGDVLVLPGAGAGQGELGCAARSPAY